MRKKTPRRPRARRRNKNEHKPGKDKNLKEEEYEQEGTKVSKKTFENKKIKDTLQERKLTLNPGIKEKKKQRNLNSK